MAKLRTFPAPFEPLTAARRRRSLLAALAERPDPSADVRVFGYGGLMWNADFPHAEVTPARLEGWRRSMCVWSALARGTPQKPGLALGLQPDGVCEGLAFRIAKADVDGALPKIWQREMWTDVYRPTWVSLTVGDGIVSAITFTANVESLQFAGDINDDAAVAHIAAATGERGRCRDYLANTVAELRALDIEEPALDTLLRRVDAVR